MWSPDAETAPFGAIWGLFGVVLCRDYATAFGQDSALRSFRRLLSAAERVVELTTPEPVPEAFWAADSESS